MKYNEYHQPELPFNGADMDPSHTPNLPYRLAMEIQEHIVKYAETSDFTVGRAEREDLAEQYYIDNLEGQVEPARLAFEGLYRWRQIYGEHNG